MSIALDDLLISWHKFASRCAYVDGYGGSQAIYKQGRSGRAWDTLDEIIDETIDKDTMKAVDFHVMSLEPMQRTSIQLHARKLVTGETIWSMRLPEHASAREQILKTALAALTVKLKRAGVL